MSLADALRQLREHGSVLAQTPHSEGNNVMSWIGFKHIMYLAQEAVLAHFRTAGLGFSHMLEEYGLVLEFVLHEGRILHALKLDETLETIVTPVAAPGLAFQVAIFAQRAGKRTKAYSGKLRVVMTSDTSLDLETPPVPKELTGLVSEPDHVGAEPSPWTGPGPHLEWNIQAPYFFCHANTQMNMSGYLRVLEEADARFCEQQGIGVGKLLRRKLWIPAVPAANLRVLARAEVDEPLRVIYGVKDRLKHLLYTCTLDVFAGKGSASRRVAAGEIVHGYAEITSRKDWGMVTFDQEVADALGA